MCFFPQNVLIFLNSASSVAINLPSSNKGKQSLEYILISSKKQQLMNTLYYVLYGIYFKNEHIINEIFVWRFYIKEKKVKKSQIPCNANHAAGSIYMGIEKRSFIQKLLYNNKKNQHCKVLSMANKKCPWRW